MGNANLILCLFLLAVSTTARSHEDASAHIQLNSFPFRFLSKFQQKATSLETWLLANSINVFQQFTRQEVWLKKLSMGKGFPNNHVLTVSIPNALYRISYLQVKLQKPNQLLWYLHERSGEVTGVGIADADDHTKIQQFL